MNSNPNATTAGATTVATGLVVWVAHKLGWTIESYYAVGIAGLVTSAVLWVGREGIRGAVRRVWAGPDKPEPPPPAPPKDPA